MDQRQLEAYLLQLEKAGVLMAAIAGLGLTALGAALQHWAQRQGSKGP